MLRLPQVAVFETSHAQTEAIERALARSGCERVEPSAGGFDVLITGRADSPEAPLPTMRTDGLLVRVVETGSGSAREDDDVFDWVEDGPNLEEHTVRALRMAARFLNAQADRTRLAHEAAHRDRFATLGLFAAGVGHEISNPGSAILSNVELLRNEVDATRSLPPEQQHAAFRKLASDWVEALDDCIGASQRIVAIVRGLGALSRRSYDATPRRVDVNEQLSTVMRLVGKEVHFHSRVTLALDPELPAIQADPHAITQILTNLVLNALQALDSTPDGARHVALATMFDDDSVLVQVTDTGAGLEPALMDRVFDPFLAADGLGSGFGLGITRQLAQTAGGELAIESKKGHGTTFRVVFPRAERVPASGPARMRPRRPTERLRLLVVDDDDLLLRSMTRLLALHFDVLSARSVAQALELLDNDASVDVILADVVMPDESGVALFEALELRFPRLAQRTIFISGGVRNDELLASIERTGRPFVAKPIEVRELARLVRAIDAA